MSFQTGGQMAEIERLRGELERNSDRARYVAFEIERVRQQQEATEALLDQTQRELYAARAEAAHAQAALTLVANSTLWRALQPLRGVANRLPRPIRLFLRQLLKLIYLTTKPRRLAAAVWRRLGGAASPSPLAEPGGAGQDAAWTKTSEGQPPGIGGESDYAAWIEVIEAQLPPPPATDHADSDGVPRFGVLIAGSEVSGLAATLRSLFAQPQALWEAVLPSAADTPALQAVFAETPDFSRRVTFVPCAPDAGKGVQLGTLLDAVRSSWFCVLEPGDLVAPGAFERLVQAVGAEPGAILIHADEDELTPEGDRSKPFFKPGHSPEMLQSFNYFGRVTLIATATARRAGGFAATEGEGAEWGLNLRLSDLAQAEGSAIVRLPHVLCHRAHGSNGGRPDPNGAAAADQRDMLAAYWRGHGVAAPEVTTQPDGTHRSSWQMQDAPLVSIIIPSHNQPDVLRMCLEGLLDKTSYGPIEIIIVENNSTDPATWRLYEEFSSRPNLTIIRADGPFNYSAVCNRGAAVAQGEILLFLNNDIEIADSGWLGELVRVVSLPGVGVVGTRLVYPDGTLQHAGVGVGPHLFALMYNRSDAEAWGVFGSAGHTRNWLAIMGACQMVRRSVFDLVGGFDESFRIANSDVALCLRAHKAGWRTAYTPFAGLIHHEGATRGRSNPAEDMARSALEVRKLGVAEDPYLHPRLSSQNPVPALLGVGEPELVENLRIVGDGFIAAAPPRRLETLDLWDDCAVARAAGMPARDLFWPPQPVGALHTPRAAARFLIELLRRRIDLRQRFPHALSAGAGGAFHLWLHGAGRQELGLPPAGLEAVDAVFADDLGKRVRQFYFWADHLRADFPLALLPAQRRDWFSWLMRVGRVQENLTNEEIWWFFLSCAENPGQELARTYRFTPAWQERHPCGLTIFGQRKLAAWLADYYYLPRDEPWLAPEQWPLDMAPAEQIRAAYLAHDRWRLVHPRALESLGEARALISWLASEASGLLEEPRRWAQDRLKDDTAAELIRPGVNVVGHFCYPSGLRVSAEAMTDAIAAAGYLTSRRDIRTDRKDDPYHADFGGAETHDITIIHTQPEPFFDTAFQRSDLARRQPRPYRIAYWYWELDTIPDYWDRIADSVDEIWAATEFVADALRAGTHKPVHTLFPGVRIGKFPVLSRQFFGLPGREDGRFAFLFSFHMGSVMERKNPLGLIEAFKRAFRPEEKVDLVLKTTSLGHDAQVAELREAARGANIHIVDRILPPDQILSLMESCDCYVSLHRSEGLGLTMAEAMLLGKPVIATRYSGNLDFMNDENSILVDCEVRPIDRDVPPYNIPNARWAEPDLDQAVAAMRRIYDDAEFREKLTRQAARDVAHSLSLEKAAERFAGRLEEIRRTLTPGGYPPPALSSPPG